jgi:hypothetical protein
MRLSQLGEGEAMRLGKRRGSYMPVLTKLVAQTTGPILELGVGFCSTPYLHWACFPTRRKLVSYENNKDYYAFAESWGDSYHEIYCINDWDKTDFSRDWSIAFLDHSPGPRRGVDSLRLIHADYLVIHDSENSQAHKYGLDKVYRRFKYRYKYNDTYPYTSIWSNKHDVRNFKI